MNTDKTTIKKAGTRVKYLNATTEDEQQRLDNFLLRSIKGVPKSHIYRLIRKGEIRVNSKRTKPLYKIVAGDSIRIPPIRTAVKQQKEVKQNLNWLQDYLCFEDKHLIVFNKPAGLAVHGGSGIALGLIEYLRIWKQEPRLELVHRIDRHTSGCLLLVKRRSLLQPLQTIWHSDQVKKTYLALVAGKWPEKLKAIDAPLSPIQLHGEKFVRVNKQGQSAKTLFGLKHYFPAQNKPIKSPELSLIQAKLVTGRTHQIRVHCSHAGYPVIGDYRYGDEKINKAIAATGYKGMFLHAAELKFTHPVTQEVIKISAPLHEAEAQLSQLLIR